MDNELKEEVVYIKKEYGLLEIVGAASTGGKTIKSIVGKETEISKDDAKTIQGEKDVLIEVCSSASEKRSCN